MKTIIFLSHLAQFFLQWEVFQTKFVEKIRTHILSSILLFIYFFFQKFYLL
jgi:hypothetical protein